MLRKLRRFKNPKILLISFIILFFLVFFIQYLQYDDLDTVSSKWGRSPKSIRNQKANQLKPAQFNGQFKDKFRNKQEETIHQVTKAIDTMKRLVHLDLKGSPPKLTYLSDLIPYFKRIGATGVLIEYEDFFPYEIDLESIRNQNHYTKQEINQIMKLLKDSNLDVIPLVQTYGHLEFVLKLKQFSHLREDKKHFSAISPCLEDSYEKLLYPMIDQVLENHPEDIGYIHIGCDEVYLMNKNAACTSLKGHDEFTTEDWFLLHVSKIVNYIKSKRPYINVMIWDDMIRKTLKSDMPVSKKLKKFAKSVVPVVWDYNGQLEIENNVWKQYDNMFSELWIASAFKGATSQLELMPNITMHYNNQLSWISAISNFKNPLKIKGIAFTGWSRYDHMQSVCEILSAALPSLTMCLQTFTNYDMEEKVVFSKSKELTECTYDKSKTGFLLDPNSMLMNTKTRIEEISYKCNFPGSNIYDWILKLKQITKRLELEHTKFSQILNDYNLKNKFFNTIVFEMALLFYKEQREKLKALESVGEKEFDKYYYSDLYEEISQVYINSNVDLIDKRLATLRAVKMPSSGPNRPFNKIEVNIHSV